MTGPRGGRYAALAAFIAVAGYLAFAWFRPLAPGAEPYVVRPGTGVRALATELRARGVVAEARSVVLLGYLLGHGRGGLKAGEYRFREGASAREILRQVAEGRVIEYPLRIIEGWSFRQVRAALAAAPKLTQELAGLSDREVMARLEAPGLHPEGRFFPDTYNYASGQSDLAILRRAHERMRRQLEREWERRDPELPLRSPEEALTLASIVEKETGRAEERRMIAGVFVNRLRKGIRLQTDPTVIYGLGPKFDGNLRLKDLRTDGPYNTYTRRGLPPTPIAMPGAEALHAALHPERTSALYFVSRGDGSHEFSDTLEAHNRAVIKYQLDGRARPFSSYTRPEKQN